MAPARLREARDLSVVGVPMDSGMANNNRRNRMDSTGREETQLRGASRYRAPDMATWIRRYEQNSRVSPTSSPCVRYHV
jgi:hypothetical protein